MDKTKAAYTYILVHGAWHGSWCWRYVKPLLEEVGHTVFAPDLPGHGQDHTPLADVTFEGYVKCIVAFVERAETPVILLGHSMGGMVISQVAEECPNKIARLVYLTAFLPRHGESAMQLFAAQEETFPFQAIDIREQEVRLVPDEVRPVFYHDCSREDVALAQKLLCVQALAPLNAPVMLSRRFDAVPRAYICCTADRVISPEIQQHLSTATPCELIFSLPSSHSAFFSMPQRLAEVLLTLAWMDQESSSLGAHPAERGR